MTRESEFWWSSLRDRIIAWIAFGPRHDECMEIERRLCIAEANARADASLGRDFPGSYSLAGYLWLLRRRTDSELGSLFDEHWKPSFPIMFYGRGPSRHCKKVIE